MPVSEKQKGYARKWDKENMHTISTRVRMEEFKDYKAWCEMRGVSVTSEIKYFTILHWDHRPFRNFIFDFSDWVWYNGFKNQSGQTARPNRNLAE